LLDSLLQEIQNNILLIKQKQVIFTK